MAGTLYIFDQGLKGLIGHYYEYVRSIVAAAGAAGFRCVVGCHEEAGDGGFASFEMHPVFRDDVWGTIPGDDYHSAASIGGGESGRFLEDVQKGTRRTSGEARGHHVPPEHCQAAYRCCGACRRALRSPRRAHRFHVPLSSAHFEGATAANAFRRLERAAEKYDVSLSTDSSRLADNLAPLTFLPFVVLPIPHTWEGQAEDFG